MTRLFVLLGCSFCLGDAMGATPIWWTTRGVVSSAPADDYSAVNIGQLKTIAKKAAMEMEQTLPGGAGAPIQLMIDSWVQDQPVGTTTPRDDYSALNVGQAKSVARKFYDRLTALNPANPANNYPWNGATSLDDYALVNVGQLKSLFAFPMPVPPLGLQIKATTKDSITLSWIDVPDAKASYRIFRSGTGVVSPIDSFVEVGPSTATETTLTGLAAHQDYYFRIETEYSRGIRSFPSYMVKGTTLYAPPTVAPVITGVSGVTDTEAIVTWTVGIDVELTEVRIEVKAGQASWTTKGIVAHNAVQFTIPDLQQNSPYEVRVIASNPAGSVSSATAVFSTLPSTPGVPLAPQITMMNQTTAVLVWGAPEGPLTGYEIQRRTGTGVWNPAYSGNATTWTDSALVSSLAYAYRIRTVNSGLFSTWVENIDLLTVPIFPQAVTALAAQADSWRQVTLSWAPAHPSVQKLTVQRRLGSDPTISFETHLPASSTLFIDSGLVESTNYSYTIIATNNRGSADAQTSVTTKSKLPDAPTNLRLESSAPRYIQLLWDDNSNNETAYVVQRKVSSAIDYVEVARLNADSQLFDDAPLQGGTAYDYRVFCTNQHGDSSMATLTATTPNYPNPNLIPDGVSLIDDVGVQTRFMDVVSVANPQDFSCDFGQNIVNLTPMSRGAAIFGSPTPSNPTPFEGGKKSVKFWHAYYGLWSIVDVSTLLAPNLEVLHGYKDLLRISNVYINQSNVDRTWYDLVAPADSAVVHASNARSAHTVDADQLVIHGNRLYWGNPYAGKHDATTNQVVFCGAVHVFDFDPNQQYPITYRQTIWSPQLRDLDLFGYSIAVDNGKLLVGAPGIDQTFQFGPGLSITYPNAGKGYTYDVPSTGSIADVPDGNIIPTTIEANALFGYSVSLAGAKYVIGAPNETTSVEMGGTTYSIPGSGAIYVGSLTGPSVRFANPMPVWCSVTGVDSSLWQQWIQGSTNNQFGTSVSIDHAMRILVGAPYVNASSWSTSFGFSANDTPEQDARKRLPWNLAGLYAQGVVWQLQWWAGPGYETSVDYRMVSSFGRTSNYAPPTLAASLYSTQRGVWEFTNRVSHGSHVEWVDDSGVFSVGSMPPEAPAIRDSVVIGSTQGHLQSLSFPLTWAASTYGIQSVSPQIGGHLLGIDSDFDVLTLGADHDNDLSTPARLDNGSPTGLTFRDYATTGVVDELPASGEAFQVLSRSSTTAPGLALTSATNDGLYAMSIRVNDDRGGDRKVPLLLRVGTGGAVVLADTDNDGIPDSWETTHGLNANNPLDALSDGDFDGLTAYQEYLRTKDGKTKGVNPGAWDLDPNGDEDGDTVPNYKDADPFDKTVLALEVSIALE